jgi:iron-sulfur cluster repair protein YtfE (RIC family)
MEETILQKLKEEHAEIYTLLLRIERAPAPQKKQEIFDELKAILIPHMEGEEKTLYAKLRTEVHDENAAKIAGEMEQEHQEIKSLLQMMDGEEILTPEWNELLKELQESVATHVEEEERDLFTEAKEDFSREELVRFHSDFEEAKHTH